MGFGLGSLNPVRIVQGKGEIGEALGPAAPVLAGLALNALAPGVGSAIGASLGLGAAAGTGALVGGISALASGNLKQGIMAGLGAYGGASLGAGLENLGGAAIGDSAKAETLLGGGSQGMAADNAAFATEKASMADKFGAGASEAWKNPKAALAALGEGSAMKGAGIVGLAGAPVLAAMMPRTATPVPSISSPSLIRPYTYNRQMLAQPDMVQATYQPGQSSRERNWFDESMVAQPPYASPGPEYKMAEGGDVQVDPNMQQVPSFDPVVRMAAGGLGSLGGYSDGGRMLKGPGDGMSDSIPAAIAGHQPARLANEEFVIPADVVSGLGNGSSESGAKQLYKMMDRVRVARTGTKKQGKQINPNKLMPA